MIILTTIVICQNNGDNYELGYIEKCDTQELGELYI